MRALHLFAIPQLRQRNLWQHPQRQWIGKYQGRVIEKLVRGTSHRNPFCCPARRFHKSLCSWKLRIQPFRYTCTSDAMRPVPCPQTSKPAIILL